MRYDNLQSLLQGSKSSRDFFLALPVTMQLCLHEHAGLIHTAQDLHRSVDQLSLHRRQLSIAGYLEEK